MFCGFALGFRGGYQTFKELCLSERVRSEIMLIMMMMMLTANTYRAYVPGLGVRVCCA